MKKRNRILSFILVLALLLSSFAVLSYAAEGDEGEEETTGTKIFLNRKYDEGWDYKNGIGPGGMEVLEGNKIFIDNEFTRDGDYNYFVRIQNAELLNKQVYLQYDLAPTKELDKVFVEFRLKIDAPTNLKPGSFLYTKSATLWQDIINIQDSALYVTTAAGGTSVLKVKDFTGDWMNIGLVFDYTDGGASLSIYVDGERQSTFALPDEYKNTPASYLRFHIKSVSKSEELGQNICIDDFKIYGGVDDFTELPADNYGSYVNTDLAKNISIKKSDGSEEKGLNDYLNESLAMKVGVDYMLMNGKKSTIFDDGKYGAPVITDDGIALSLDAVLEYLGYPYFLRPDGISYDISTGGEATYLTIGRKTATVGGKVVTLKMAPGYATEGDKRYTVIGLDDIETLFPGFYVCYDDMGLIIISKYENLISRDTGLQDMINLMNRFIFDDVTGEQFFQDFEAKMAENGGDLKTHPRVQVTQSTFDSVRAEYEKGLAELTKNPGYNDSRFKYINDSVNWISSSFENFFKKNASGEYEWRYVVPSNGEYFTGEERSYGYFYQPYYVYKPDAQGVYVMQPGIAGTDMYGNQCYGDGYDVGGRSKLGDYSNWIKYFGFAYQMTGDTKYVEGTYLMMKALIQWKHWGEGHFLNNADGVACIALGYDWLYNGFDDVADGDAKRQEIAEAIIRKSLYPGWAQFHNIIVNHSARAAGGWNWSNKTNNWVTVCDSGMMLALIAVAEYQDYEFLSPVTNTLHKSGTLMRDLFTDMMADISDCLGAYAPDGSYVESPAYWGYGTNTLFLMIQSLMTATGKDYGLLDSYGLDSTCNFVVNIESNEGMYWNYHDAGYGSVDTKNFSWFGMMYGQYNLIAIRKNQLDSGAKSYSYEDLFYYYPEYQNNPDVLKNAQLEYYWSGIDTFVARDSWESGAIYTGLHAGANLVSHGQIDAGNFVYTKYGVRWFTDLGSDNYNLTEYWTTNLRYKLYRMNAEGHNTVIIDDASLPHGEDLNGVAKTEKIFSNEHGAYSIINTTNVYKGLASSAKRGLLFTSNRKTVVIQDEITLPAAYHLYWVAQTDISQRGRIEVSVDGKQVVMNDGNGHYIRVTMVTKSSALKFTVASQTTKLLDATYDYQHRSDNGVTENKRTGYKLVVDFGNVLSLNFAIVIEDISDRMSTERFLDDADYTFTSMNEWVPAETGRHNDGAEGSKMNMSDVAPAVHEANNFYKTGAAFGTRLVPFYNQMCKAQALIVYFREDLTSTANRAAVAEYNMILKSYDDFREAVSDSTGDLSLIGSRLLGMG